MAVNASTACLSASVSMVLSTPRTTARCPGHRLRIPPIGPNAIPNDAQATGVDARPALPRSPVRGSNEPGRSQRLVRVNQFRNHLRIAVVARASAPTVGAEPISLPPRRGGEIRGKLLEELLDHRIHDRTPAELRERSLERVAQAASAESSRRWWPAAPQARCDPRSSNGIACPARRRRWLPCAADHRRRRARRLRIVPSWVQWRRSFREPGGSACAGPASDAPGRQRITVGMSLRTCHSGSGAIARATSCSDAAGFDLSAAWRAGIPEGTSAAAALSAQSRIVASGTCRAPVGLRGGGEVASR